MTKKIFKQQIFNNQKERKEISQLTLYNKLCNLAHKHNISFTTVRYLFIKIR